MANNDTPTLDNYVVKFAEAATSHDLRYMAVLDTNGRVVAHTTDHRVLERLTTISLRCPL